MFIDNLKELTTNIIIIYICNLVLVILNNSNAAISGSDAWGHHLLLLFQVASQEDSMTDVAKKVKNASQDFEAKMKTEGDHLEGKPSSETLNKAKIKARDALT